MFEGSVNPLSPSTAYIGSPLSLRPDRRRKMVFGFRYDSMNLRGS
jgi:hypothetical protein